MQKAMGEEERKAILQNVRGRVASKQHKKEALLQPALFRKKLFPAGYNGA